jgi:hypothetical protein
VARERHDTKHTILDIDTAVDAFLAAQAGMPAVGVPAGTPGGAFGYSRSTTAPTVVPLGAANEAIGGARDSQQGDAGEAVPVARLDSQDIELLHEFMARRTSLGKEPRRRLAQSLARRLSVRLEQAPPVPERIEEFLESVARALR